MTGHGCPSSFVVACARVALALALCAVGTISTVGQNVVPPSEPLKLQITWGGGDATAWVGQVSLDQGTLSDLQLISRNADAAGSVWLEPGGIRIRSLSAHKTDGVEVDATAPPEAKLLIELSINQQSPPARAQVALAELARRPFQMRLDEHGNTLEVRSVPPPAMKVSFDRSMSGNANLILTRGDQLTFEIEPVLPASLHGTTLDIQTTLTPARQKAAVWNDNQKLAVPIDRPPRAALAVPLQVAEGVYTVRVVVARPSGYFRDKFLPGAAAPIAERSFQIVVLETQATASGEVGKWEQVLEIDPTNPRWVEKLPAWTQLRRIPGISNIGHGALGSLRAGAVDLPLGRFIELPATTGNADPHWQSYSLPLQATGVAHLLEIEYPADKEQSFGLSIVEPNSAGVIQGLQRDAGVFVEGLGRSEAKQRDTHRLVFWPRTQSPLLVIANQHPSAPAHFGRIRVMRRLGPLNSGTPREVSHNRLVAAYLSRPLVAESLGVADAGEPVEAVHATTSGAGCQSCYEGVVRLADYMRYGGFNGAVVSITADGRVTYPGSQLLPTHRANAGHANDQLKEIDGLELLLRIFDREHLTLVPAIEFAAPIARLEELRRTADPQISGLELVGPDGRTWLESNGSREGLAPYYNVLDPRVQQAMLELVIEVKQRYGTHPSFGGIAVQLSSDGYSQLPPLEWGLDDATVGRFTQDTGIAIAGPGANRFAARQATLTGPHAAAWRNWRIQQLTGFYQRMAAIVNDNGRRQLLLTTERLFDHPLVRERIRPNLLADNRVVPTLLELGVAPELLDEIPGVALCPTRFVEPLAPLSDRAVDLEANAAFARWSSQGTAGERAVSTLFHPDLTFRIASFNAVSPFRLTGEMRVHSRPLPGGAAARRPYVLAVHRGDPAVLIDGGEVLPLGQEDVLRNVRASLAALPMGAQVAELEKQSILVRTYSTPNETVLLVMNSVPWRVAAIVTLDVLEQTTLASIIQASDASGANTKPVALAAGRQVWPVSLEPYDIQVVRIANGGVSVADVSGSLAPEAVAEFKSQLDILANRDLSAPRNYGALVNPSFEPLNGAAPIAGWHLVGNPKTAVVALDAKSPQDGKASLYLRNAGQFAAVESEPFAIPATGQLAMTVFARGQNIAPNADLRLVIEAESGGQLFRRAARVAGAATQRTDQQWGRPFAILVGDLPLDSRGQVRIKFELTGPGELWLDNVRLNDLLFSQKFYQNSQAEIVRLLQRMHEVQTAYDEGQLKECIRLLDGYWPRFVLAYTPPATPVIALGAAPEQKAAPPPNSAPPPASDEPPASSFQDRLKRMVPILR